MSQLLFFWFLDCMVVNLFSKNNRYWSLPGFLVRNLPKLDLNPIQLFHRYCSSGPINVWLLGTFPTNNRSESFQAFLPKLEGILFLIQLFHVTGIPPIVLLLPDMYRDNRSQNLPGYFIHVGMGSINSTVYKNVMW